MKHTVVITAGGTGSRIGGQVPKQLRELNGQTVLGRSLIMFSKVLPNSSIVITLPENWHDHWNETVQKEPALPGHQVVKAGTTRFHSVNNALNAISDDSEGFVWIHDGARPLVSEKLISDLRSKCTNGLTSGLIPSVKLRESVRKKTGDVWMRENREQLRLIQTPQVFPILSLKQAYRQPFDETFTDDATVYESAGYSILLTEGEQNNIKITWPGDWKIAKSLLDSEP